jgi:phosphoglycolate phosphatase
MQLEQRAGCVISGDTCEKRKPHPQPILHACELLDCEPKRTWYIGDAGRDIEAGRAAGCVTVGALYGYLHPEDPPDAWQSDLTIDKPEQLLDLLNDDSSAA